MTFPWRIHSDVNNEQSKNMPRRENMRVKRETRFPRALTDSDRVECRHSNKTRKQRTRTSFRPSPLQSVSLLKDRGIQGSIAIRQHRSLHAGDTSGALRCCCRRDRVALAVLGKSAAGPRSLVVSWCAVCAVRCGIREWVSRGVVCRGIAAPARRARRGSPKCHRRASTPSSRSFAQELTFGPIQNVRVLMHVQRDRRNWQLILRTDSTSSFAVKRISRFRRPKVALNVNSHVYCKLYRFANINKDLYYN